MFKAITKSLALALALATFGTGCDFSDIGDAIDGLIGGRDDIVEPGIPEPVDPWMVCETELDDCLNNLYGSGIDDDEPVATDIAMPYYPEEDTCWTAFDDCMGDIEPIEPVDPPVNECDVALDECLGGTWMPYEDDTVEIRIDDEICWIEYDECMGYEPPAPHPCDTEFETCLTTSMNPEACEQEYLECWGIDDPYFACDVGLQACLVSGVEPEICFEAHDLCLDAIAPEPWDACGQLYDDCVWNGVDPLLCDEVYTQCTNNQPYPCDDEPEIGEEDAPATDDTDADDQD